MGWGGLYGHGMHDFVLREIEIGYRAALYEDEEYNTGLTALNDICEGNDGVQPDHD